MNTPPTQNAPATGGNRCEGQNTTTATTTKPQETFVNSFPQSKPQSKAATLANGWSRLADLFPPHQSASDVDPLGEEFAAPAWCTTLAEQDDDGPQYPVQANPSMRVSVSRKIDVPMALHRGRHDRLGDEHVVVPASAGVYLHQHHGHREPVVRVTRTEHVTGADGQLEEVAAQVFQLRSGEARELGEVLMAAADLADTAAHEVAVANGRYVVGQADAEAQNARMRKMPEVIDLTALDDVLDELVNASRNFGGLEEAIKHGAGHELLVEWRSSLGERRKQTVAAIEKVHTIARGLAGGAQ